MEDREIEKPAPILGFVEDESQSLKGFFNSKIGGTPNWLHYTKPLNSNSVTCKTCKEPMILLLQLYAPEDFPEQAYHRMIYLFICRNGKCHKAGFKGCLAVLRSQISKENDYYKTKEFKSNNAVKDYLGVAGSKDFDELDISEDGLDDSDEYVLKSGITDPKQCVICGLAGTHSCSECRSQYYCSKAHQIVDWTLGQHKANCASNKSTPVPNYIFKEYEIVSEVEVVEAPEKAKVERSLLGKPDEDELEEDSVVEVDKPFLDFQSKISHNPNQVIRYARNPDYDTDCEPLWVNSFGKPDEDEIPKCELCGSERKFELQVMPQLINYLNLSYSQKDGIDWGTLLIYTCPGNCEIPNEYKKEFVWRQNFSSDGIGTRYAKATMNMLEESDLGLGTMNI